MVIVSGYWSELYATELAGWHTTTFRAMTRGGKPRTEWLWYNFEPPAELHDYRYLGSGFRERERIKRKKKRWVSRLERMPELERQALLAAISTVQRSLASPSDASGSKNGEGVLGLSEPRDARHSAGLDLPPNGVSGLGHAGQRIGAAPAQRGIQPTVADAGGRLRRGHPVDHGSEQPHGHRAGGGRMGLNELDELDHKAARSARSAGKSKPAGHLPVGPIQSWPSSGMITKHSPGAT